jgi:hypothetical protein
LLGTFSYGSVHFFYKPRENWEHSAAALRSFVNDGACVVFTPPESSGFYTFFDPGLDGRRCTESMTSEEIAVARSPYDSQETYSLEIRRLAALGYRKVGHISSNGPVVELYLRTGAQ